MSAFAFYLTRNSFFIATDTLVYTQKNGVIEHAGFAAKTHYFPEIKTCITCVGHHQLSVDLNAFIRQHIIAHDTESLIPLLKASFLERIDFTKYIVYDEFPNDLGRFEVFGYSATANSLVGYELLIERDGIEVSQINTDSTLVLHPPIEKEAENQIMAESGNLSPGEVLTGLVKQMYAESFNPDTFKVGIGGEIVLTEIHLIPNFCCCFSTVHRFENFDQVYASLIKRFS